MIPRGALVAACAATILGACTVTTPPPPAPTRPTAAPSPSPTGPRAGGSLKLALITEPEFIDPALVVDDEGLMVVDALFDSLTAYDDDLEVVPAAASSWEVTDGGRTWTFHLRPDGRFHDGRPVTAADFARAFERVVDGIPGEPAPNAHHLALVEGYDRARGTPETLSGVEVVDELTLRIRLTEPYYDLPAVLAHPSLAPVPDGAEDPTFRDRPIGNGPFAMAQPWEHGRFIRVVRSDTYPARPLLDEVVFQIHTGTRAAAEAYANLLAGRVHVAPVPAEELPAARTRLGRSPDGQRGPGVIEGPRAIVYYLGTNTAVPPFDDVRVRRAVSLLVDRGRIAREVLAGTWSVATALTPPPIPGAVPGTCSYCRFDPATAAELLADAGVEELTLTVDDHSTQRAVAERIAADAAEVGIRVRVEAQPFAAYLAAIGRGEVGWFRLGWQAEYPLQDNFVATLLGSVGLGDTNVARFTDPEVDARIAEARATPDTAQRRALYAEAERLALEQAPVAPVVFFHHALGVAGSVRDLVVRGDGSIDLTRVWLADAG